MSKWWGIILTLSCGLFFLIGGIIATKWKNQEKLNHFSVGMAFIVMLSLIIFDLFPELLDLVSNLKVLEASILIIIFIILGFLILKILDLFIPFHHHDHKDNEVNHKEHISHMHHVGILTIIGLILHNIMEGFMIFGMGLKDFKIGVILTISIALHNIPLGTHIFSNLKLKDNKILGGVLTLSSLLGGTIFLLWGDISNIILAIVTSITIGMLLYILILELALEVFQNIKKKETVMGISLGIVILIISCLI